MKKDITELFVFVDDFCNSVEAWLNKRALSDITPHCTPTRVPGMRYSEIMIIVLLYHQSPCKNFKYFYNSYAQPSYNRFIELKSCVLAHLALLLEWYCHGARDTGISYVDSTPIAVCHPKSKVFAGIAKIGKTTKGWLYGFKLHLIINEKGEIQSLQLTAGNVDDREPVLYLAKRLTGLLLGDKGYIKQELFHESYEKGVKLITGIKKGMINKLMLLFEKILLRKRSIIETGFSVLSALFRTRTYSP